MMMNPNSWRIPLALLVLCAAGAFGGEAVAPVGAQAGCSLAMADDIPLACLAEPNHGACVNCCKEAGFPAFVCSRFCRPPVPPPQP